MEWQIVKPSQIPALAAKVAQWPAVVLDTETTGVEPYLGDRPLDLSLGNLADERCYALCLEELQPLDLRPLFEHLERLPLIGHNIKFDLHNLAQLGWDGQQEMFYCVMVMARIWSKEERPQLGLKPLSEQVLSYTYQDPEIVAAAEKGKIQNYPFERRGKYCCEDVLNTRALYRQFRSDLAERQLDLFAMECRLTRDLYDIECRGQLIDQEYLRTLAQDARSEQERCLVPIRQAAGRQDFNPKSPQQMRELMSNLSIQPVAYTKRGGVSWDREALLEVRAQHPVALEVARHNALVYLRSNMIDRCEGTVKAGHDALHGTFQQTTVTGRLRSTHPNRQNDPHGWLQFGQANPDGEDVLVWATGEKAHEKEFSIERLFVARPDHVLVIVDYRQIEMYVLGHYMKDPVFDRWLASGNVHAAVAAEIWGDAERYYERGKTFNFAMVYGVGDQANSARLKCSIEQAAAYRQQYFSRMPGYPKLMRRVRRKLTRDGYAENLFGRQYWVDPERTYVVVNYLVQGSAGDHVKFRLPATRELRRQMELSVLKTTHDDFAFEIPRSSMEGLPDLLRLLGQSPFGRCLEMDVEWGAHSMVDMQPWTSEAIHAT